MSKKKLLLVTQELDPYTIGSQISEITKTLPKALNGEGYEVRVLMPSYGKINKRRHRLHEVVRLSGMNIIVNEEDYPLIINVASYPGARLQVYFLDNEDFFKRKMIVNDENGKPFADNDERTVFFCKGVLEIVKKFGWPPDIVFCHGWMTSLLPFYLKTAFKNDPVFQNSKVVTGLYGNEMSENFTEEFLEKATTGTLEADAFKDFLNKDGIIRLEETATKYSDGLVICSEDVDSNVTDLISSKELPSCNYTSGESFADLVEFLNGLIPEEEEEEEEEK